MNTQGFVSLIGAGCGKADLITLRGRARLEGCGAVVYDDLIDPALLDFVPPQALRIYMGKREGRHSAPQQAISEKLVELARQGLTVARLKGGDPFVFGRGGEEIAALQQAGIPFEVVPGISSAIAIPAGAGIPVTHRGLSRSFHVVTGHTADGPEGLPADLPQLAKCGGTLVFLMGLSRLSLIARRLTEHGMSPATPAAVISGGNSPNPAAVRGTLADIAEKAAAVLPPAVIVVGQTAALELTCPPSLPLSGLRVGLTGTPRMIGKLRDVLEPLGAGTVTVARSVICPLPPDSRLKQLTAPEEKWVALTSPNAVELFFRQLRELTVDLRALSSCRFAAIGAVTARALEERGILPDLCPDDQTSAGLAAELLRHMTPGQALFLPRSTRGSAVLRDMPAQAGYTVHEIPLYDTLPDPDCPAADLEALDRLVFSSAGGVEDFFARYPAVPAHVTPLCIGAVTAAALYKHDPRPCPVADRPDAGAIARLLLQTK